MHKIHHGLFFSREGDDGILIQTGDGMDPSQSRNIVFEARFAMEALLLAIAETNPPAAPLLPDDPRADGNQGAGDRHITEADAGTGAEPEAPAGSEADAGADASGASDEAATAAAEAETGAQDAEEAAPGAA